MLPPPDSNLPAAHATQYDDWLAPTMPQLLPGPQTSQEIEPDDGSYLFKPQAEHPCELPEMFWYVPGLHSWHELSPVVKPYLPRSQKTQVLADVTPENGEYFPAEHGWHTEDELPPVASA